MTEQNQTLVTLEKIKAFAIGFIGAGIFSMGSTYFSEQASYNIPRILYPVYEIFGNIGLAVGMLVLGGSLMYYAYKKFERNGGKATLFLICLPIALVIFYGLIYITNRKPSAEELNLKAEQTQKDALLEMENTERPKLENAAGSTYLDRLEELYEKYKKAQTENSKPLFEECEKEYQDLVGVELGKVAPDIASTNQYKDFAMYNAKVLGKIQEVRIEMTNK